MRLGDLRQPERRVGVDAALDRDRAGELLGADDRGDRGEAVAEGGGDRAGRRRRADREDVAAAGAGGVGELGDVGGGRAAGAEASRPAGARRTTAIGPCRKSAADAPSARMPVVSLTFSADSSAAPSSMPRAIATRPVVSEPIAAAARVAGSSSASSASTASGSASQGRAPASAPSASARIAKAANCDVTVLVAGTARSAPAAVSMVALRRGRQRAVAVVGDGDGPRARPRRSAPGP